MLKVLQPLMLAITILGVIAAHAAPLSLGPSGLPLPRFASLKSDRVNMRQGPSRDHAIAWQFQKAGLPVEITAEFETWRRIRDSEGTEGWVEGGLLSGRRTALVVPWDKAKLADLYARPSATAAITARMESGVLVNLDSCDGQLCRVSVDKTSGWVRQETLWGVYPNEKVD